MAIHLKRPVVSVIDGSTLDSVMETMINNDQKILPESNISPKIWKCGWYNQVLNTAAKRKQYLYQKGDAVWLNTENLDEFVRYNQKYIESVVNGNSDLRYALEEYEDDETGKIEFFKKIATGEITGNADGLPLFCIGDITQPVKIRVSIYDNNDRLPTDTNYWRDFFNDNETNAQEALLSCADTLCQDYLNQHLRDYHLSGIDDYLFDTDSNTQYTLSDYYLFDDLRNVTGMQKYTASNSYLVKNGFDYVVRYYHKRFNSGETCKWFRVWNSGLVEHGGIVKAVQSYAKEMNDSLVYSGISGDMTHYKVNLGWSIGSKTAPVYKYGTNAGGFYLQDSAVDFGNNYKVYMQDMNRTVGADNRYVISLTPIYKNNTPYSYMSTAENYHGGYYCTTDEVNSILNGSFCFVLTPGCDFYSYYTVGFVPNAELEYK